MFGVHSTSNRTLQGLPRWCDRFGTLQGLPRWCDRFGQYGIKVEGELLGLWDPQNRDPRRKSPPETCMFRLDDYHPLGG
jgi:hypothetical protein